MAEALLRLEVASCILIGVETRRRSCPSSSRSPAPTVLWPFLLSAAYDDPNGRRLLAGLRNDLLAQVALWVGGELAPSRSRWSLRGVDLFPDLNDMVAAFRQRDAFV